MTARPETSGSGTSSSREELRLASRRVGDGIRQTEISVPDMHCGGCMRKIETALNALGGVEAARANLSTKRIAVRWFDTKETPPLIETLRGLGYAAHLHDAASDVSDPVFSELIRALAVAGFASSNIMLLSVSVWSGADEQTRGIFHAISAMIAFPALLYSGRIFFRSAWSALRHGRTNMDVPISIGVILAFSMSMYDTVTHGPHAYFDAAISLLFFLLIGRTLDYMMRERARTAVKGLERLIARGAHVIGENGRKVYLALKDIQPGMLVQLAVGSRAPVDGIVESGASDLDCSLVSGESAPCAAQSGSKVQAGTLNLTAPLMLRVTAAADNSFLAEMVRLMEAAETGRAGYRRIADRVSRLYAPVVHLAAFLSFLGWMAATGGDWHRAVTIAVAVLIITCPCALGLAVPIVQVTAARRLFEAGIMVRDGSALERLADIDCVVFDKTGTLTRGELRLAGTEKLSTSNLTIAAALAAHSLHPHSRALAEFATDSVSDIKDVSEYPGLGVEAKIGSHTYRLGRASWAAGSSGGTVLACEGAVLEVFDFQDSLRPGAHETLSALQAANVDVEILSGDVKERVASLAHSLGVSRYSAGVLPGGKTARLAELAAAGRKVLMVGDGLNDVPALASAYVSMAPASAADIGRNAADFVFLRDSLEAVVLAREVARNASRLVRQNFILALLYNVAAVPLAVLGHVTPLVAALAMSGSSLGVIVNALRLKGRNPAIAPRKTPELRFEAAE